MNLAIEPVLYPIIQVIEWRGHDIGNFTARFTVEMVMILDHGIIPL